MSERSRYDVWDVGDSYDAYMGRWSRQIAPLFLDWLDEPPGLDWLEVGCGTGALSTEILERCAPKSLISIDTSEGFITRARATVCDGRAEFLIGDGQALAQQTASRDVAVSALVLNFVPDKVKTLAEMRRVVHPGGTVGFYVWDYPGGGLEFLSAFWTVAAELDPVAEDLTEDKRFPFCTPNSLIDLARNAGLLSIECAPIEAPTKFKDFEDWRPFTLGAGPAPGYYMSLPAEARQRLKDRLYEDFARRVNEAILMKARAWAIKSVAA
ncbi:MAG: class I SAM-dependent methyltransferase [Pseudomonadota bacterium]